MNKLQLKFLCAGMFIAVSVNGFSQSFSDYKNAISKYEGIKLNVYKDSEGFKTIGIGHKLTADESFTSIALDKCNSLFAIDLNKSIIIARRVFPSFDTQPKQVKIILVQLVFQMGQGGVSKFKNFRQYIHVKDYKHAANELVSSKVYRQTPNRIKPYINILNNL